MHALLARCCSPRQVGQGGVWVGRQPMWLRAAFGWSWAVRVQFVRVAAFPPGGCCKGLGQGESRPRERKLLRLGVATCWSMRVVVRQHQVGAGQRGSGAGCSGGVWRCSRSSFATTARAVRGRDCPDLGQSPRAQLRCEGGGWGQVHERCGPVRGRPFEDEGGGLGAGS